MTVTFQGFNTHPGYAKGRMVNAIKIAADFISRLPEDRLSPETTDGYEGYVHPYVVTASVERTSVKLLIRDFKVAGPQGEGDLPREAGAQDGRRLAGRVRRDCKIEESYRNMNEVLDQHPQVVENAREAIRRAGLDAARAPDPRRHRRLAAVVHGPAHPEPLRRRAQLPLPPRVGLGRRTWRRRSRP